MHTYRRFNVHLGGNPCVRYYLLRVHKFNIGGRLGLVTQLSLSLHLVARHFNGILGARAANVSIKKCFILNYSRLEKLREITVERS